VDKTIADLFVGEWIDAACRFLQVRVLDSGRFAVTCLGPDRKPFSRRLLEGEAPSIDMPATVHEGRLVVEVGTPDLGPTLCLAYSDEGGPVRLVPEVRMGLYDDWEDDFGVPWLFPLSAYRWPRAERPGRG
jgi:hypothetical protein